MKEPPVMEKLIALLLLALLVLPLLGGVARLRRLQRRRHEADGPEPPRS